jgi:FkbM family methyltransferase
MVDAGAHIGLASLYFAQRFPECQILALEPEPQNFELLQKNTGSYSNITPMQAALWGHSTTLSLVDQKCGNWAFQMEEREGEKEIPAITVEKAKNLLEASMIDILKMDIEGAEEGVLENYFEWGGCVRTVIVELHGESRVYGSDKVKKIESEEKVKRRNIGENVVLTWE